MKAASGGKSSAHLLYGKKCSIGLPDGKLAPCFRDITVTMGMLRQMYGVGYGVGYDGVSTTDRLLDFSTPLSSAIYFVPSIDVLLAVGISPADPG